MAPPTSSSENDPMEDVYTSNSNSNTTNNVVEEVPLRSAKDYESEEALRQALVNMNTPSSGSLLALATASAAAVAATGEAIVAGTPMEDEDDEEEDDAEMKLASLCDANSNNSTAYDTNSTEARRVKTKLAALKGMPTTSHPLPPHWDWVLTNYDAATTEPQTVTQELHRLKVLMSYMILDSDREEAFDRLTNMASRVFDVPIALVSLVDLGRQWFMSNHGLGDCRQTSRDVAFCAHAIQMKNSEDIFIVKDTLEDKRFQASPLVLGAPHIRFYAGAPLISSEGCKLGTFCIIDRKPWPQGLTDKQAACLKDFASITVQTMADRRHLADQEDPSRLVACTAHDLLTPLSGVLLSLSMLKDDDEFASSLNEHQKECIATAARSSEMMRRICQTTIETLRKTNKGVVVNTTSSSSAAATNNSDIAKPFIDIREFVKSLHMIIDPIPKRVPLVITVESSVPMHIVSDDLKIFRSSLNLLSNACRNTETGSIRFRMYVQDHDEDNTKDGKQQPSSPKSDNPEKNHLVPTSDQHLVFECEDSGPDINANDRELLFHPHMDEFGTIADLGLYSLAAQIDSLNGKYGFRPRGESVDGKELKDTKGRKVTGSIFWFSIPIVFPAEMPRPSSSDGITHLSGIRSVESFTSAGASVGSFDASNISRNNSGLLAVTAAAARSMSGSQNNCLDCLVRTLSTQSTSAFGSHNKQPLRGTVNSTWDSTSKGKSNKPLGVNIMRIRQALGKAGNNTSQEALKTAAKLSSSSLLAPAVNAAVSMDGTTGPIVAAPKPDAPRKKKALVIEDSVVVRKTLARALQKLGYEVTQAVDGMEGLKELKKAVFDVSLCDFLMPNMDGLDCVQQYRKWEEENRPSFRQYIVGISAHASQQDITKGLEIGMNDFKPKPVTIKILTEIHESTELVQVRATLDELHRVTKSSGADKSLKGKKQQMDADAIRNSAAELSTASLILQRKRRSRSELALHLSQSDDALERALEGASNRLKKRGKFMSTDDMAAAIGGGVEKACLIATDSHNYDSDLGAHMAANGWRVTLVQDGNSVLRMLKTRNWGAVLLDDELPLMSGSRCVAAFREWESKNRVSRQNNVFLVCSSGLPSPHDATSVVQAPCGFDGALDAPVMWKDVKYLLKKSQVGDSQHRGGLSIVTR